MKFLSNKVLLIPILLALLLALVLLLNRPATHRAVLSEHFAEEAATSLQWQDLLGFDYKTGAVSEKLRSVNQRKVRFPGFVVPLTDDMQRVSEFLLVPDPMACIHLPPPPPNQMVYVKMVEEMEIPTSYEPIWVTGRFELLEAESQYGEASFQIEGVAVEPYEWKD